MINFPDFIARNVSLKPFNTFGLDVPAAAYLEVKTAGDLARVFADPRLKALPRLVVGGGSNLLLTRRFEGLVLKMAVKGIKIEKDDESFVYVRAGAGENWHSFVLKTLEMGLSGLENLSGIPGTAGAAPVQNIGAYGAEVKDVLYSLRAFDFETGKIVELSRDDCRFSYRESLFKQKGMDRYVIMDLLFALPKKWKPNTGYADVERELERCGISNPSPADVSRAIVAIRRKKIPDPAVLGNAGSFFKNPTVSAEDMARLKAIWPDMPAYPQADGRSRIAAGWLIDRCGWKGKRRGDAGVCENQALVLVNYGRASGRDILDLADAIRRDVFARFGIRLEQEPVRV